MSRIESWLSSRCPNLSADQYQITSDETSEYNCIAWAAGEDDRWWDPTDPDGYWPDGVPRELTLAAFIKAYETLGYVPCDSAELESGFQKIAIYTKEDAIPDRGQPTHVVRQFLDGKWKSKIGDLEDIEHPLDGLTGFYYGSIAQILKRPLS